MKLGLIENAFIEATKDEIPIRVVMWRQDNIEYILSSYYNKFYNGYYIAFQSNRYKKYCTIMSGIVSKEAIRSLVTFAYGYIQRECGVDESAIDYVVGTDEYIKEYIHQKLREAKTLLCEEIERDIEDGVYSVEDLENGFEPYPPLAYPNRINKPEKGVFAGVVFDESF